MGKIITEADVELLLDQAKDALLVEPPYRRKYMPVGLAKIAAYLGSRGTPYHYDRNPMPVRNHDMVFVTSLFTFHSDIVLDTLQQAAIWNPGVPVVVGGIYASLNAKMVAEHTPDDVFVFPGYSKKLDQVVPEYGINYGVDPKFDPFSITFTQRGCPNRCGYCAVHRIEKEPWIVPNWRDHIAVDKPFAMISDNNLSSQPDHLLEVIRFVVAQDKHLTLDNGLDCKLITKEMADVLAKPKYERSGCRLAFDRIEEDGVFQPAIEMLIKAGVPKGVLMAYVLFNFMDTPKEAHYRASECVRLGIRPYPQQYEPLTKLNRSETFIGKHWRPNVVRAFRNYWLLAGYWGTDFEQWIKTTYKEKHPGNEWTDEDWECWNQPFTPAVKEVPDCADLLEP